LITRTFHADQLLIQPAEEIRQMVRVKPDWFKIVAQILDVEAVFDSRRPSSSVALTLVPPLIPPPASTS
jgi:hypothetical protein